MPNGIDRHLFKVENVIGVFQAAYGVWPTRLCLHPIVFHTIRLRLLTEAGFAKLSAKLEIVVRDDFGIVADDGSGRNVDIRNCGLKFEATEAARHWLELEPSDLLPEEPDGR